MSPARPAVVLDVNETLSDMTPLAGRFAAAGLPPDAWHPWFTTVLRDGMGLTAAGAPRPFAEIGAGLLRALGADDAGVATVLEGFLALPPHPDVGPGITALVDAGHRVVTLSQGSAAVAEGLLGRAGVRERVEACLSVDDAGAWKPAARAYAHAAAVLGLPPDDLLMVAVHAWDLDGAARAGLRTAWIDREGLGRGRYPTHLRPPDLVARGLGDLAAQLAAGASAGA
ncbi:MAG: haloacid dehalogenase type II [Thermoleophilia bacterium]